MKKKTIAGNTWLPLMMEATWLEASETSHPVARSFDKFPETCEITSIQYWMACFATSPMTLVVPQHQLSKSCLPSYSTWSSVVLLETSRGFSWNHGIVYKAGGRRKMIAHITSASTKSWLSSQTTCRPKGLLGWWSSSQHYSSSGRDFADGKL
jgi:hypothetical protein